MIEKITKSIYLNRTEMKAHSELSELSVFESMTKAELLQSCYGGYLCKSWTKGKMLETIAHKIRVAILSLSAQSIYKNEACYVTAKPSEVVSNQAKEKSDSGYVAGIAREYGLVSEDELLNMADYCSDSYQKFYLKAIEVYYKHDKNCCYYPDIEDRPIDFNVCGWYDGWDDAIKGKSRWSDVDLSQYTESTIKSWAFFHYYTYKLLWITSSWLIRQISNNSSVLPDHVYHSVWSVAIKWRDHTCVYQHFFLGYDKKLADQASHNLKKQLWILTGYLDAALTV